jgi:hypothetical protein
VFADLLQSHSREELSIAAGTFHAACGGITYLVSGRKP